MPYANSLRLDFWPADGKAIAIAPTFDEDLAFTISDALTLVLREAEADPMWSRVAPLIKSEVVTPTVQFLVRFGAVHQNGSGDVLPPGEMIFLCMVAQTKDEFLYDVWKV